MAWLPVAAWLGEADSLGVWDSGGVASWLALDVKEGEREALPVDEVDGEDDELRVGT